MASRLLLLVKGIKSVFSFFGSWLFELLLMVDIVFDRDDRARG